jgi:hypothetical protein
MIRITSGAQTLPGGLGSPRKEAPRANARRSGCLRRKPAGDMTRFVPVNRDRVPRKVWCRASPVRGFERKGRGGGGIGLLESRKFRQGDSFLAALAASLASESARCVASAARNPASRLSNTRSPASPSSSSASRARL